MSEQELIEQLADKEHASWAHWMEYLFSRCPFTAQGDAIIPRELVARWKKQVETPYANLTEQEKQSDRNEVMHILPIIREYVKQSLPPNAMVLTPAKGKNIYVSEYCQVCHKAKSLSYSVVFGDDPDAVELPEQCRCMWFSSAAVTATVPNIFPADTTLLRGY